MEKWIIIMIMKNFVFKNTENGQMYCLDKQQRKILYKINKYEDMLKFLNQKYEIENFDGKIFLGSEVVKMYYISTDI